MLRAYVARGLVVAGLLSVLLLLAVRFGALGEAPQPYSVGGWSAVVESDVGTPALLIGTVASVDPVVLTVSVHDGRTVDVVLTAVSKPVARGDRVIVYGEVVGENRLAASTVVVQRPASVVYTYVVSLLAGVWVLARLGRHWAFDVEAAAFVPRNAPLDWRRLTVAFTAEDDTDRD